MVLDTPVLMTERLILRAHRLDDFADLCAMWADPEIVKFIGGEPQTPEQVWQRLLRYTGNWRFLIMAIGPFSIRAHSNTLAILVWLKTIAISSHVCVTRRWGGRSTQLFMAKVMP
jgi:hypothetical protein